MDIKDMVDLIITGVIAVSTVVTMIFIGMQLWIFKKQRQDNLFKLICELRQDVIEQLKKEYEEMREDVKKTERFDNSLFLPEHTKNALRKQLIIRAEYLCGTKLAKYLTDNFDNTENLGEYNEDLKIWIPSIDFEFNFGCSFLKLK